MHTTEFADRGPKLMAVARPTWSAAGGSILGTDRPAGSMLSMVRSWPIAIMQRQRLRMSTQQSCCNIATACTHQVD